MNYKIVTDSSADITKLDGIDFDFAPLKILTSKSSQSYVVETIILTLQMRKLRVKS